MFIVTDTPMPKLVIRMVTSMDMVDIHTITAMQKRSLMLMFIVMDIIIQTVVAIPTVIIMAGTRMGILMDTRTMVLKKSCHLQNNLT